MADAKAALRKSIRATLRALSPTAIAAASDRACARANTLISAETSGVCCYLAMPKAECLTGRSSLSYSPRQNRCTFRV